MSARQSLTVFGGVDGRRIIVGAVHVHDRRPSWDQALKDGWGYGELLMSTRSRRPLHVGDEITLPDGSSWPVISTREFHSVLGWRQHVVVGEDATTPCVQLAQADLRLAS
jgi:hypothetical protein